MAFDEYPLLLIKIIVHYVNIIQQIGWVKIILFYNKIEIYFWYKYNF